MFGVSLGEFEAEVCPSCGESFLSEAAMRELETRARDAGVWGLGKTGSTLTICGILAYVAPQQPEAPELSAEFGQSRPVLREAITEAPTAASGSGYAPAESCEAAEAILRDVEAEGALPATNESGHIVRFQGQTYRIGLSMAAA